jgi:hypothetical protein
LRRRRPPGSVGGVAEDVSSRGGIGEIMWALADIRVDVIEIRKYLLGDDEEEAEEDDA